MACCSSSTKLAIVAVVGVLLFGSGLFLLLWMPGYIDRRIATKMALNTDSESYENWQKTPIAVYLSIFLFNITNPTEYFEGKAIPKVQQMGPYNFLQYREKNILEWDDSEDTVTYTQQKKFIFDPTTSVGSLSDNITVVNVPLAGLAKQAQTLTAFKKFVLNGLLQFHKAKPYVQKTVEEILFEGYNDKFFAALAAAQNRTILPDDKFGLFYGQNNSNDGVYVVKRGNQDISEFGQIQSWNNQSILSFWGADACNMINGTDGSMFGPGVLPSQRLEMFTTDLSRSVYLDQSKNVITRGIRNYRYSPPDTLLASPLISDANKCFCLVGEDCLGSGVLNISSSKNGAPIVVSLPHFYLADKVYVESVEGVTPNKDDHETYLDVEPYTGIVMNASKRLQINVMIKPVKGLIGYDKLKEPIVFPLMWVNESAAINDANANKFKRQLQNPIVLGKAMTYGFLAVGGFVILCAIIFAILLFIKASQSSTQNKQPTGHNMNHLKDYPAASEKLLNTNETIIIK